MNTNLNNSEKNIILSRVVKSSNKPYKAHIKTSKKRYFGAKLYTVMAFFVLFILSIAIGIKFTSHASNSYAYNYISVKIEAGDTVNSIASKHLDNTYMNHTQLAEEIIRINRLPNDIICEGAYIIIPVADNSHAVNL